MATKKLSDVELEQEEISTKFYEANQTIGALRFENNFFVEKTKKLEADLFQVREESLLNIIPNPYRARGDPLDHHFTSKLSKERRSP